MKISRKVRCIAAIATVAILACGVVLYVFAGRTPAAYSPAPLTVDQRQTEAGRFLRRVQDFGNQAETNQPFTWVITQDELNRTLGSAAQIADKLEDGKAAEVHKVMDRIGIADPAVAMEPGVLTIMARSKGLDKVISIDIGFTITPERKLVRQLLGTRLGRLPVPESLTEGWRAKLRDTVARKMNKPSSSSGSAGMPRIGGLSTDDMTVVLVEFMLNGEAMPTEFTWPVGRKRVRIDSITIEKGQMTLHVLPSPKRTASKPQS